MARGVSDPRAQRLHDQQLARRDAAADRANLAEYAEVWATRGVRGWEDRWWEMPLEVGNKIARVIGAPAGVGEHARERHDGAHDRALVRAAESAATPIVCSAMDFPSMIYLFRAQQARGFEMRVVPGGDRSVGRDRTRDRCDRRRRTAFVAFSHVLFRTSYIMDAAAIAANARAVGASVILDAYQSAGIVPRRRDALGVDFAVGGCLKWLCGGPGNAFLYTRPDS